MPAFFIRSDEIREDHIVLSGDLSRHLKASLRVKVGESILLTDERRRRYRARVADVAGPGLTATIYDSQEGPEDKWPSLLLAQAVLKGDHMDWVIQKSSELGVRSILPLIARRGVVRPRPDRLAGQLARWQRIATEAAQQSEQWEPPRILEPLDSEAFFFSHPTSQAFILLEHHRGTGLLDVALPAKAGACIGLAVGPEGGWAREEIEAAQEGGLHSVTLGPQILRAETAAVSAVSILQCRLGRLG
jgi:16S rRNA (uracil1498-N3)-methyltransferase